MNGSAIVYRGPSRLDAGAPIIGIVTGLARPSKNPKTGPMAQLWILRDDDDPLTAIATAGDYAICGDCQLRNPGQLSGRACYVAVRNAPMQVYRSRGRYPTCEPDDVNQILRARGLSIRLGAYGDPAALPVYVLAELTAHVSHTGYTHQWASAPLYRDLLMASADTEADVLRARALGWRTFRARTADAPLTPGEITCPASDEAGRRTTCDACGLCDGSHGPDDRRRSIAIVAHGSGARAFHPVTFWRS